MKTPTLIFTALLLLSSCQSIRLIEPFERAPIRVESQKSTFPKTPYSANQQFKQEGMDANGSSFNHADPNDFRPTDSSDVNYRISQRMRALPNQRTQRIRGVNPPAWQQDDSQFLD